MMKILAVALIFVGLGGLAHADTIVFVNEDGIELGGENIEVLSISGDSVRVRVQYGTIEIGRQRIHSIHIDYAARRDRLVETGRDTPRALFELAVLCDQLGMFNEASEAYAMLLHKPAVDDTLLRLVAENLNERQQWPEARMAYERLLATNPADAELRRNLELASGNSAGMQPIEVSVKVSLPVEDARKQPEAPDPVLAEVPDVSGKVAEPEKPAKQPAEAHVDGLEAKQGWRVENWGNRANCTVVTADGQSMLRVDWSEREKDKVGVRLNLDLDLTDKTEISFDAFNDADSRVSVCVAFSTMPGYQFFESIAPSVPVRMWERVTIDLARRNFKSQASNWRHTTPIENRHDVQSIFILIYNRPNATGTLYINNITIK